MTSPLFLAQIGCGYWGPNLLRATERLEETCMKKVVEINPSRALYLKKHFPRVAVTDSVQEVLDDPTIEAILIVTPAATHYELAKTCLDHGKHVFIEKPFATSAIEAEALIALGAKNQKIVMCGHTFLYHSTFQAMKDTYLEQIGDLLYLSFNRLNLGKIRTDVNAWWNLAPHDVSMLLSLVGKPPSQIAVHGSAMIQKEIEDLAFATLRWDDGLIAQIHVSWLNPQKVRECTVVGSRKMLVFDDLKDYKLCVFDRGIDRIPQNSPGDYDQERSCFIHRQGDVFYPAIEWKEPLQEELRDFARSIHLQKEPLSNCSHALQVVRILEAGQKSLKQKGTSIFLKEDTHAPVHSFS